MRKSEKVIAPPLQRVDDKNTYYTIYCSRCNGRFYPRIIPSIGAVCAKCWGPAESLGRWRIWWQQVFSECCSKNNWAIKHKSPTQLALNTIREYLKHHPGADKRAIVKAVQMICPIGAQKARYKEWVLWVVVAVEQVIESKPVEIEVVAPVKQLQLTLFGAIEGRTH